MKWFASISYSQRVKIYTGKQTNNVFFYSDEFL